MASKDQTLLLVDSGLFTHTAQALAPYFKRTMYFSEWVRSGFPQEKHRRIGDGLPGIERVSDVFGALGDADLVVFPDVVTATLASYVKEIGKPVFGTSKHAAELELDRWGTRAALREAGLPLTEAVRIVGVDDLEKFLKKQKDVFVKYGRYRGDLETFHHQNWFLTEQWFTDTKRHLGPSAEEAEFVIEDPIPGVEIGVDSFSIDGEWPSTVLYGYELKDAGYVGRVVPYSELPPPLAFVCDRLAPVLKEREHRGWISTECRVNDATPYLIDPCMRCGSPPSEAQTDLWENLGEIVSEGASGKLVEPIPRYKYVAELILKSEFAVEHFLPIDFPEGLNVSLHNHTMIGGKHYVVPIGIPEIGAVSAGADTLDGAVSQVKKAAEKIKAYGLDYDGAAFDDLADVIEKGRSEGIEWK